MQIQLSVTPSSTKSSKANAGKIEPLAEKTKGASRKAIASSFLLKIDGLELRRVVRVEAMSVELKGGPSPGRGVVREQAPPQVAAMQAVAKLQNEARRAFEEKIAPVVFKAMSSTLQTVLTEQLKNAGVTSPGGTGGLPSGLTTLLLTEDEMKAVARGVLFNRNVRERFQIAQVNMKSLLDPGTAPGAVNGHMENLRKLVQGTKDYEALYLEIGVEMLRVMAHKYMKSKEPGHGGYLLDQAIGLLQTGEGSVEKVLSALCGLIPEAGAAVCAVIEEVVELAWSNVVVVAIEGIAQGLIDNAIDQLVDGLKEEILRKKSLAAIRSSVGPLGDVLRALPHEQAIGLWAGAIMNEEMEMLNRHFSSLADLAAKART